MKSKFLFLMAGIFLVLMLNGISAVVVYGDWQDSSQSIQIVSGQSVDFSVDFFSMSLPMNVNVKLYDSQSRLVHSFENGKVVNTNGFAQDYTITPAIYQGTGNFQIVLTATDAFPSSDSQSLSLRVLAPPPANNLPVITSAPVLQVNESTAYSYDVSATDADGDTLTYSLTTAPAFLSINANNGLITGIVPAVTTNTPFFVSIQVSDGIGSVTQTYNLTVVDIPPPANNLPVITSTAILQVNESQTYSYQVVATDADGDPLTYTLTQKPTFLSISTSGLITGTAPAVNIDTPFLVTVSVSDGKGGVTQAYTLTVINVPVVNNLPVITSAPILQVNEGQAYSYDVNATDADGDALTYSLTTAPAWLSINANIGLITGTAPAVNIDTPFNVVIQVSDGIGTVSQSYTVTVVDVPVANNLPVITSSPVLQINENQSYSYQVVATDADGDALTYSLTTAPVWLAINPITGLVSGTAPVVNADTNFSVTIQVSDGIGNVNQAYTIIIIDVPVPGNNLPVITSTPLLQINENQNYSYQVVATDADGNTLTYSLTTAPAFLSINTNTGLVTGTAPSVTADTSFNITIQVSDGVGFSTQSYILTVVDTAIIPPTTGGHKSSGAQHVAGTQINTGSSGGPQVLNFQQIPSQAIAPKSSLGLYSIFFGVLFLVLLLLIVLYIVLRGR